MKAYQTRHPSTRESRRQETASRCRAESEKATSCCTRSKRASAALFGQANVPCEERKEGQIESRGSIRQVQYQYSSINRRSLARTDFKPIISREQTAVDVTRHSAEGEFDEFRLAPLFLPPRVKLGLQRGNERASRVSSPYDDEVPRGDRVRADKKVDAGNGAAN